MSRRRPAPSQRRPDREKRPPSARPLKGPPSTTPVRFLIITATLAALANAVFVYQVLQPTSFLSAIRGVEINRLPRATWEEMYQELRSRLAGDPVARKHDVANTIVSALAKVDSDTARDESWLAVANDNDNLVSRLGFVTLLDFGAGAAVPAKRRFEDMRRVVEGKPPPTCARLYNEEFTQAWHEVLKKRIRRADVAASAAVTLNHYQIVDHFAALPKLQRRLSELAGELRTQGHATEADVVARWLGQTFLGLIDSEKDAGTRLLCAELIAKSSLHNSELHNDLQQLHDAYHLIAEAAPPALTDLSKRPSPAPRENTIAALWLTGSLFLFTAGCAGFAMFAISTLIFFTMRLAKQESQPLRAFSRQIIFAIAFLSLFSSAITLTFAVHGIITYGYYSQSWILLQITVAMACGFVVIPFISTLLVLVPHPTPLDAIAKAKAGRRWKAAMIVCAICWIIPALLLRLPAPPIATALRRVDVFIGSAIFVAILLEGGLFLVSLLASRSNLRSIILVAVVTWCVNATVALAALQMHRSADTQLIQKTEKAFFDEFPARLGPDWQEKYLQSARAAYAMPLAERDIPRP